MPTDSPVQWLFRIPEVFAEISTDALRLLEARLLKKLGREYFLVGADDAEFLRRPGAALFVQWNVPAQHAWPCNPQKMEGFIEKAAQALLKKFGVAKLQAILTGPLNAGAPQDYYKGLASNLRGRLLQLFPSLPAKSADSQEPDLPTLFVLTGREGLYGGVSTPRDANGFHPGGTRFVSHGSPESISRAGAKIAEALHYLLLHRAPIPAGSHWLDLGASPGGMTSELLARGFRVTAVDRAPLDVRLDRADALTFVCTDVSEFRPAAGTRYDAILCDMNGPPQDSLREVARLAAWLKPGGVVIFTLKLIQSETVEAILALRNASVDLAATAGLKLVAQTHLTYNRREFTLFFELSGTSLQPSQCA